MGKKIVLGILIVVIITAVIWVVSLDKSEKEIEVGKGETFLISLESNPTTGYRWEADYDADFVRLAGSEFISEASGDIVGAGGQEVFEFLALREGEIEINFAYRRHWEDVEPINTAVYRVIIK